MASLPFLLLLPLLVLLIALAARAGVLRALARRPLLVTAAGVALGLSARALALPVADPDLLREAARLGLAVLVFLAAQQARVSAIGRLSPPALRLVLLAVPALMVATAGTVFAVLPGLGPWSACLIGATMPLGVAAFDEAGLIAAPVGGAVKRAVRLDASLGLVLALPVALLVEAATIPLPGPGAPEQGALFAAFAGGAVGGAVGLLAGRLLGAGEREGAKGEGGTPLPPTPLLVLAGVYAVTRLIGFDAVMAAGACGLLYAEEAGLSGRARGALFAAGRRWCGPPAFLALGATLGPVLWQADLLVWIAALVPVVLLRALLRAAVLGGVPLGEPDRGFLAWFGGVPGAGAALFVVSLLGSPADAAQTEAITVAALSVFAGLVTARLSSGPLITRLIHATARARKRRYGTASVPNRARR